SYNKGLNPARQLAETQAVAHATVYRVVDEGQERAEAVERALGRAAFEAQQSGAVVVVAHSYPETVKALFAFAAADAKGTALAPASAVMIGSLPAVTE